MANYDPQEVVIVVDGEFLVGFAEDSMIEAGRMNPKRDSAVGAQGRVVFIENADDRGEVTITLQATSPSNEKLQELYESGEEFSFLALDSNFDDGDVSAYGSRCKVANQPPFERGSDLTENEWELIVADYETAFENVS